MSHGCFSGQLIKSRIQIYLNGNKICFIRRCVVGEEYKIEIPSANMILCNEPTNKQTCDRIQNQTMDFSRELTLVGCGRDPSQKERF